LFLYLFMVGLKDMQSEHCCKIPQFWFPPPPTCTVIYRIPDFFFGGIAYYFLLVFPPCLPLLTTPTPVVNPLIPPGSPPGPAPFLSFRAPSSFFTRFIRSWERVVPSDGHIIQPLLAVFFQPDCILVLFSVPTLTPRVCLLGFSLLCFC